MNTVELPKAATLADIRIGIKATDKLYTPGFLIPPDVMSEAIGLDIIELAKNIDPSSEPRVPNTTVDHLRPVLEDLMGVDIDDEQRFTAIQFKTTLPEVRSHTDWRYQGGALWISGETLDDKPRELSMATVFQTIEGTPLEFEKALPFSTNTIFKGLATVGWTAYFLAKGIDSEARTAHRVDGEGIYARFGEHDTEGVSVKQADLRRLALVN